MGLTYEIRNKQLHKVVSALKTLLEQQEDIPEKSRRVSLVNLGAYDLSIEVNCSIEAEGFDAFLQRQQDLLMQFIKIVEAEGAAFAFPSQMLYREKDKSL